MTAFLISSLLVTAPQLPWPLPVTIRVLQDVQVFSRAEPGGGMRRGRLYIDTPPDFVIRKGRTFEMFKAEAEGGCRIRFEKREHFLGSCPWMPGFRDRQADIFEISPPKKP
jgi:hypothetical protein